MDNYKYLMIVDWVKEHINSKGMKPNDRFLTEKQLCDIHGVSRQTVRQALMLLESENIIVRVRGSGTFVGNGIGRSTPVTVKGSIGVISTYFSDYIFPHIVTGVESVLGSAGCTMQLAITHNQVFEETQALESMLANGVQGLIVEPSKSALPNPNMELYARLKREHIPLVFFNAKYPWADQPCVAMDDVAAGRTVTDHLFNCGHTEIAGIFALDDIQGHKRYSGYMESCLAHGVAASEKNVMWFATSEKNDMFTYASDKLLGLLRGKTAVVCYNDKLAVKLLRLLRENGIRVPEDMSVVGIDDSRYASICEVPLTTVHHPQKKLGEAAAQMLLDMIDMKGGVKNDLLFTPELVVRDSVLDLHGPEGKAAVHKRVKMI
ncbi:GntR family transcriptional regulator [Ruminococcus sp.]|uniref:GntR family transcriptional regulator n=1 Tax=Ruminococcus sp. TaxID=41978 RepID=UPI0025F5BA20|nr:GntR family transcriptional regulator [Ruminococcus sp.]MBQ8965461.1 GntR family transcriptional regulator [Ruminococcus sp.]